MKTEAWQYFSLLSQATKFVSDFFGSPSTEISHMTTNKQDHLVATAAPHDPTIEALMPKPFVFFA